MQSPAPSEYFPGIKFNYSFYTTGDTKVTLEYVNNNFLKCVGYAYSRAISTSFNGIIYVLGGIETTTLIPSGLITANNGLTIPINKTLTSNGDISTRINYKDRTRRIIKSCNKYSRYDTNRNNR